MLNTSSIQWKLQKDHTLIVRLICAERNTVRKEIEDIKRTKSHLNSEADLCLEEHNEEGNKDIKRTKFIILRSKIQYSEMKI